MSASYKLIGIENLSTELEHIQQYRILFLRGFVGGLRSTFIIFRESRTSYESRVHVRLLTIPFYDEASFSSFRTDGEQSTCTWSLAGTTQCSCRNRTRI